mmetsp:Transcript_108710/g.302190  ORF Transcript_108710/g.302190 Transcript_108710/m.302190 type:complete len:117 (-) Transcript_108710:501-851(-)
MHGMVGMPGSIGRIPMGIMGMAVGPAMVMPGKAILGEGLVPRLLAIAMNFADGLRNFERSHFSATACWWGGSDRSCREAPSSRSLSSMNLLIASDEAPIIALFQAAHTSPALALSA